jgi:hypothetical protein
LTADSAKNPAAILTGAVLFALSVYRVAEKIVKLMLNDGETLEELQGADET